MSIDLDFDDGQRALADAVATLCRDQAVAAVAAFPSFSRERWSALAALGVFELAEGPGRALDRVAVVEALGRAAFAGPILATFLACDLLPVGEREAVASGDAIACVAEPPVLPFGPEADVFIEIDPAACAGWRARVRGALETVGTLGDEPFGRASLERLQPLAGVAAALERADLTRAVYLVAAGRRLIDDATTHARTRKQFGRAIGEFQAVAHPLADATVALDGATTLTRMAAWRLDEGDDASRAYATAARRAATRAALDAIHVGHQVFGAVGIMRDGPAFPVSRRIRQLASLPPGDPDATARILEAFVPEASSEVTP